MNLNKIPLTGKYGRDKFVLVSPEDIEKLEGRRLCCNSAGYVMIWNKETSKAEYLHRWLFGLIKGDKAVVDHIDRNILNCQRINLRKGTTSENMCNRKKLNKNGKTASEFKGVTLVHGKWTAKLIKDKKTYYLGTFDSEIEAAKAYNAKALELHKGYAVLNIIPN
jgi:hypothetical protein